MSINLDYIVAVRGKIADVARHMLEDQVSYIEGSRQMCYLLHSANLPQFEKPFVTFFAIASETDEVPVGEVRERWHPDAKIKFAEEWANAEHRAKATGETACKDAIVWLADHPFEF